MSVIRCLLKKELLPLHQRVNTYKKISSQVSVNSNIRKSNTNDITIPEASIPEIVFSSFTNYHQFTAIECLVTGKKYSYEQLRVNATNLSKNLRKTLKLESGDVVAIILENSPDFAVASLGTLAADLVITTFNPRLTIEELEKLLQLSTPRTIITSVDLFTAVKTAASLAKITLTIITVKNKASESVPEGAINFEELINNNIDFPNINIRKSTDVAALPFSSGTTGLPKGVQLTHRNLIANLLQTTHKDFNHSILPSDSHQDISPLVMPMFHIFGFEITFLMKLLSGTKLLSLPGFRPQTFISALKDYPITHIYAPPPLLLFMTSDPQVKADYFESTRVVQYGGAPVSYTDEKKFLDKIQKDVIMGQSYGMTETSPLITFIAKNHKLNDTNGGSIGQILPNTLLKVIDPQDTEGKPLGPNEAGELLVKGPQVTPGYYKAPEINQTAFLDGWYRTGDIGHYNSDGWFFISDRVKELIKVKGFQVAPAELESLIRLNPSVEDVAVIGVPHSINGEVPRAYVIPKKGMQVSSEDIMDFVKKRTVNYKWISGGVRFVDSIPKTPSGKILKRTLREQYKENKV